jgi:hypothetical protein|tara:strand:+ start:621 stop:845 length:225 start_codon:yes stop_codon:yes gene_type:complete
MKNLYDPQFIESALSDFQVVSNNLTGDPFTRAEIIRIDTDKHMLEINKAYITGDRERFFALFQEILKQEQDSNE